MKIYAEEEHGITQQSLAFFNGHKHELGDILEVQMIKYWDDLRNELTGDGWEPLPMRIKGTKAEIHLSGCNSGYGGEGPNGSVKVLKALGYPEPYCNWPLYKDEFVLEPPEEYDGNGQS